MPTLRTYDPIDRLKPVADAIRIADGNGLVTSS
jgi:hypothetical protein